MKADCLENKKFGRLTVIKMVENYVSPSGTTRSQWLCKCDCGNHIITTADKLKNGNTKSCGCLKSDVTTKRNYRHGMRRTRLYRIYSAMVCRCENKNAINYHSYGGRGITVCDEWRGEKGAENFIDWAKRSGYDETLTIDRIDVNGNYCPENCKWSTRLEQGSNRTDNHFITINGETHTISEWSRISGIGVSTICQRIKAGAPEDEAVFRKLYSRKGKI